MIYNESLIWRLSRQSNTTALECQLQFCVSGLHIFGKIHAYFSRFTQILNFSSLGNMVQ